MDVKRWLGDAGTVVLLGLGVLLVETDSTARLSLLLQHMDPLWFNMAVVGALTFAVPRFMDRLCAALEDPDDDTHDET